MFLGRSEMSHFFENFQSGFTQKRLDVPVSKYDFWNQRNEIYKIGLFLGRSDVSQNFGKQNLKVILVKNGWMCLLYNMLFGISASSSNR